MTPGREKGEVQMGDGAETGGDHEEVAGVAAEDEGGAGWPLELEELVGDEGNGVAGATVGDQSDDGAENSVGKVVDGGGHGRRLW